MAPTGTVIGALLVVGAGAFVVDSITEPAPPGTVGNTDAGTSQRLVQQSIDEALRSRSAVESPSTGTPPQLADAVVADTFADAQASRGELPNHLQEIEARVRASESGSAQRLVQESIDAALAGNAR